MLLAGSLLLSSAMAADDHKKAGAVAATPFYALSFSKHPSAAAMTETGRALFFDPALSASGKTACASCHDPVYAFGPPDEQAVRLAGVDGRQPGRRAVPSLRYLQNVPSFTEHYIENDGDGTDQGPTGGHTWDGRAASVHEQALLPLLSPFEMANASLAAVVARLRDSASGRRLREVFADDLFDHPDLAGAAVLMALEVFQQSPAEFYPYDSKYDAWLRGQTPLSEKEKRGLALFNDPAKGNCAICHPSGIAVGAFPAFTDYGYIAIGAPRNPEIPANLDRRYYDLGLCGPERKDFRDRAEYCGLFRTPSLRNVALRRSFMHNGIFHSLEDVLHFYVERDTKPGKWYPRGRDGKLILYDDLPAQYRGNVNTEPPFAARADGSPVLSEDEIGDVIAFLETLTDGYKLESASP